MKTIIISLFMAITAIAAHAQQKSFYDFTVKTIDGEDLSLSTFKGKTLLVFINGIPKKVKTAWKTQKNITSPEIYHKFRGLLYLSFSESGEKVIYPTNQINYNNSSYDHCNDTT